MTTSAFNFVCLYLDESWDHAVWYYSIPTTIKKKILKHTLSNNSCNNNFKYCVNKLYDDCKHLIVLIIVECRLSLVQSVTWLMSLGFNNRFYQSLLMFNNQATAEFNDQWTQIMTSLSLYL